MAVSVQVVGEGVGEEELGELALPEGDQGGCGRVRVVGLHLHALTEVHERFVDFACFGEGGAGGLCGACAFGACMDGQFSMTSG